MRNIKFRYVLKDPESGNTVSMIFTIREIEYNGLDWIYEQFEEKYSDNIDDPIFDQWNIIARDQYTELKDKNGEEIFEGDIVTGSYSNLDVDYSKCGAVEWGITGDSDGWAHLGTTGWVLSNGSSLLDVAKPQGYNNNNIIMTEIIGNIHENSELLKE